MLFRMFPHALKDVSFIPLYRRTRPSNSMKDPSPARVNKINNLRELGVNHPVNGRRNTRNGLHMLGFSTHPLNLA